jgi:hypothetical protein
VIVNNLPPNVVRWVNLITKSLVLTFIISLASIGIVLEIIDYEAKSVPSWLTFIPATMAVVAVASVLANWRRPSHSHVESTATWLLAWCSMLLGLLEPHKASGWMGLMAVLLYLIRSIDELKARRAIRKLARLHNRVEDYGNR